VKLILYPKRNKFRQYIDLSGFWDFRFDLNNKGLEENWKDGFKNIEPIAVPASWNDIFAEGRDFLGPGWYQTNFNVPVGWQEHSVIIRFGSVNYLADIWLNGEKIGSHEGGHLPFEFEITEKLLEQKNLLIVRVDGELRQERVPPSGSPFVYPSSNFDFFPFCGIHRPVLLYMVPKNRIKDITVRTDITNDSGIVNVKINSTQQSQTGIRVKIEGFETIVESEGSVIYGELDISLSIKEPKLWSTQKPNLYDLTVELIKDNDVIDSFTLKIGIRTIEVTKNQLLLNGNPIQLYGFGRHEDFPIIGRGYNPAVIIKDYSLMKWIGANSFRTTHYPYSEQMMDLADQLGFLIIDEIPAVGLTFNKSFIDKHLELCQKYIEELIARDKNHPSVIMWSLANEPQSSGHSKEFFRKLFDRAKQLDPTRLVTLVNAMTVRNRAFEFLDIICLNRYQGWYTQPGQIKKGIEILSMEIDKLYQKYQKPIILSEFGADTIPGWHAQPPEMFSEEYQVKFLKEYIKLANSKDFIVGQHVWNLCDFKTGQSFRRVGAMNYKGVFTRDRRPKMAAHTLKEFWKKFG